VGLGRLSVAGIKAIVRFGVEGFVVCREDNRVPSSGLGVFVIKDKARAQGGER